MVIRYKHNSRLMLITAVLCASLQVYAADGNYLNLELDQLLQIPVTGSTLRDESLKTVPSAVTVFTHDQLEKFGIDYLYELLSLVPGYQFDRGADSGVNYTFSSRGRRNGSLAREVLVVMDGRILASPRSGSTDVSLPFIPLEQIERVEIICGPGSAIYGSSAFSGVINIVSRATQNSVKIELGSEDRRSGSVMVAKPIGDWSTNLYARVYEDDGQSYLLKDSFSGVPLVTQDPRRMVDFDLGVKRNDTQFHLAYHETTAEDFYTLENTQNGFNYFGSWLKQFSLQQGIHIWDGVNSQIYIGYLANQQDLNVAVAGAGTLAKISRPSSNAPLLTKITFAGENYNLRITNNWTLDDHSEILVGAEWKREKETEASVRNNFDLGQLSRGEIPINYYGDFSHSASLGGMDLFESAGLYGQYQRSLSQHTGLTLGLRYDKHDDFGGHSSPRLGLVHQLTEAQTIKLLYGEAYRTPSLSEVDSANNPLTQGGAGLTYEMVKTWDLIWMANWSDTSLVVSGFRNNYRDPIVAGFIGTTRTFVNAIDEKSDGVSMEMKQYLTQQWSLRATYTHFLNLPKTAFREAKNLASAELNFNEGRWNWNLLGYHQGHRYVLGANNSLHELDDFWVFNSKLRYRFQQGFNLSLQLKNMQDLNFSTPAQGVNLSQGVPNRGRELSLTVDWIL